MLKKKILSKVYLLTLSLFIVLTFCTLNYLNKKDNSILEVEYVSNIKESHLYLLNKDNYLVKVDYLTIGNNLKEIILNILNELYVNNTRYSNLKGLIPSNTKINKIEITDKNVLLDFSSDLLKVNKIFEEKVIESIVYSLIELDDIENVLITINDKPLNYLEKNKKSLPILLNESIGINKTYDISSIKNIEKVTLYYSDNNYYIPVTKYINSQDNKVKIIIDSLKGNYCYNTNLRSYLSSKNNIDYKIDKDILTLTFDSLNDNNLESITYSLASSIFDSININKVIFEVDSKIVDIKIRS